MSEQKTVTCSTHSIHSTLAGFIVWLARQHVPANERGQCPWEIERFLRWQSERRAVGADCCYQVFLAQLRIDEAPDHERTAAAKAIGYFRDYLAADPA